ncbi:hypothetical protein CMV_005825 [Castanea mollissima]|uniref:Uncharacterized protein n=1 Tax=Castanea mollissima TaxID=60419 RepID=A0A8J4RKT8_9ROSI|nr:hypothetical protein CMV_005825 [Castanea mollissima]
MDIMDVDDNFALSCLRPWPPHLIKFSPLHRGGGVGTTILWWKMGFHQHTHSLSHRKNPSIDPLAALSISQRQYVQIIVKGLRSSRDEFWV